MVSHAAYYGGTINLSSGVLRTGMYIDIGEFQKVSSHWNGIRLGVYVLEV
jgi:hypothetical protein